ncbi:unnamed protein product [Soboliphyme baturini]|uniref:DDE_Tnp_1_7 domain-containing protein n=1 Tax=Soboliphyme baturini TaxID=241478 RepID=A0A183IDK4_9BILA|nr:unnamed protein product [Soboliphyme baturini]
MMDRPTEGDGLDSVAIETIYSQGRNCYDHERRGKGKAVLDTAFLAAKSIGLSMANYDHSTCYGFSCLPSPPVKKYIATSSYKKKHATIGFQIKTYLMTGKRRRAKFVRQFKADAALKCWTAEDGGGTEPHSWLVPMNETLKGGNGPS